MSEVKHLKPSLRPWRPAGVVKIRFDHSDIEKIADATNPVAAITALVPTAGPFIAAGVSLLMWYIKRVDKKYGNRGVVVMIGAGLGTSHQVLGPDEW